LTKNCEGLSRIKSDAVATFYTHATRLFNTSPAFLPIRFARMLCCFPQ
jgi:hypothetical protein